MGVPLNVTTTSPESLEDLGVGNQSLGCLGLRGLGFMGFRAQAVGDLEFRGYGYLWLESFRFGVVRDFDISKGRVGIQPRS